MRVIKTFRKWRINHLSIDTVYALGCDINNIKAMEKLAKLKHTTLEKAQFSIICNNLSHLSEFTRPIETSTFRLLKSKIRGPIHLILEANKSLPLAYKGKNGRNPCSRPSYSTINCRKLGHPIASTSIKDDDEVIEYSTDPELIAEKYDHLVDIVIDSGCSETTWHLPS